MTTHYINLTVVPDLETNAPQLLGVLYDRFHKALAEQSKDDIGISFPRYSLTPVGLGNLLRLHGKETVLQQFIQTDWLKGMRDHVRLTEIEATPDNARHRSLFRKQFKTNVERLRRRRMKRKDEAHEQAVKAIPSTVERKPDLPFVHLHSLSTQQPFCLFLALGPLHAEPVAGAFNSYGLSQKATVPWF